MKIEIDRKGEWGGERKDWASSRNNFNIYPEGIQMQYFASRYVTTPPMPAKSTWNIMQFLEYSTLFPFQ